MKTVLLLILVFLAGNVCQKQKARDGIWPVRVCWPQPPR